MEFILKNLAIGSYPEALSPPSEIDALLCVASEREIIDPGCAYHRVPMEDMQPIPPGQIRLRVRYRSLATPWFDYLFVTEEELEDIVGGTGWKIDRLIHSGTPVYVGVLRKENRGNEQQGA